MSTYCAACGSRDTATAGGVVHHFPCPHALGEPAPVAAPPPMPSAYDADQAAWRARVEALEQAIKQLQNRVALLEIGTLRTIKALEDITAVLAKLTGVK